MHDGDEFRSSFGDPLKQYVYKRNANSFAYNGRMSPNRALKNCNAKKHEFCYFGKLKNITDKSKNIPISSFAIIKNKSTLTIGLYSLSVYAPGPKFGQATQNFAGSSNLNPVPGSGPGTES